MLSTMLVKTLGASANLGACQGGKGRADAEKYRERPRVVRDLDGLLAAERRTTPYEAGAGKPTAFAESRNMKRPAPGGTVLLDTNVWSYLAEHGAVDDLYLASRRGGAKIAVAPTVVEELKRTSDAARRLEAIEAVTRSCWTRLMPDAYSECAEVKAEIRRLRPAWVIKQPNLKEVNRLRYDWTKAKGGYWERARHVIEPRRTDESMRNARELELARVETKEIRQRVAKGDQRNGTQSIHAFAGLPDPGTPGWDGDPIDYWRLTSHYFFRSEMLVYTSPVREWIDSEIDVGAMMSDPASMNRLWFYEMDPVAVRRQWMRGAFNVMHMYRKVTPGTPGDAAMSTFLVEVDLFVSADKNFVELVNRCRKEAPFPVASAQRISGGTAGIEELMKLISGDP